MKFRFPLTRTKSLLAFFSVAFALAITPIFASEVQLIPTPAGGKLADATVDTSGGVHLAFMKDGNVLYTSSQDEAPHCRIRLDGAAEFPGDYPSKF